ncbi:uncharacterized protein K452DRAFT_255364, partial [Aplosporella prunicola CBS 121167]
MQFKTLALAAATAGAAAAADAAPKYFGLVAIQSGSEVQNLSFQAAQESLFIGKKDQGATCDKDTNFATFYLDNGGLYLYRQSATPQQVYVDRGKGQGVVQYTTGAQPTSKNGEKTGFSIAEGKLQFDGTGFQACKAGDDGYVLWLDIVHPAPGYEDCTSIDAHVQETTEPISCLYT